MASARPPTVAAAPSSNLELVALKSLQPWPQLWPDARSKLLQPSAPRRPLRASQAEQLRARRPLAKPSARDRPSLAQRSFGLRPVQPQLSRGKRFCDSTRSSGSARPNRCSLRLNYPPVTASRRLLAGLRKPQARRPPLLMKRCESAKQRGRRLRLFALKPSQNKDANFKVFAPSVEIAAALASTMAQRSLKVVTAVGPSPAFASVTSRAAPRAKTACEAQARATAPV